MNALKTLVHRVQEVPYPVAQLHITVPMALLDKLVKEFIECGGELKTDDDNYGVFFGSSIAVHVDDELPAGTFKIVLRKSNPLPIKYNPNEWTPSSRQ